MYVYVHTCRQHNIVWLGGVVVSVKIHLRDGRTNRRRESKLVHLWHLVAIILMNFVII